VPNIAKNNVLTDPIQTESLPDEQDPLALLRKESSKLIEDSGNYVSVLRKKVLKDSLVFNMFDCPNGLGYYLVNQIDCGTFKLCQDWDKRFAAVTLNKCINEKIFNFRTLKCVSREELIASGEDLKKNCVEFSFASL
jgi:hypothetical protein